MKKLFITAMLLAKLTVLNAQDMQSLEETAQKVIDHNVAGEYEQSIEYIYPKVFNIISKQSFLENLPGVMQTPSYTISFAKIQPDFSFGDIKYIDNGYYCLVEYNTNMKVAFNDAISDDDRESTIDSFKAVPNAGKVDYDVKTKTLSINKREKAIAVCNDASDKKWKFIYNDGSDAANVILDEKVKKELGL